MKYMNKTLNTCPKSYDMYYQWEQQTFTDYAEVHKKLKHDTGRIW